MDPSSRYLMHAVSISGTFSKFSRRSIKWSGGKAIYATGVQFPSVHYDGNTFLPGQANNFYVYPAVGLAIYATRAKFVTDGMCIEAARAIANQVTDNQLKMGMLFPPQSIYQLGF